MRISKRVKRAASVHEPALALHIEDLTVSYHTKPVLWDIDLDVPPGVLGAIVGPNGAGKTTLLKSVLGLVRKAAGHVYVHGRAYQAARDMVGYVPQRNSVDWDFPTTAIDVVQMGLYGKLGWFRRPGSAEREQAREALDKVGMADFADRQISQLSGGQQQRVFLARALVQDASLLLMDEPFAGVDATTERAIVRLLQALRSEGKTVVVVHHDLQTVQSYFDWMALLNVRMVAFGPIDEVYTAENLRAAYGGQIALLDQGTPLLAEASERDDAGGDDAAGSDAGSDGAAGDEAAADDVDEARASSVAPGVSQ
jgi:manganese/zinc/iron transport system ATP- binding protein